MKLFYIILYHDGLDPSTTAALQSSANVLSSDTAMIAQSNLNKKTQQFDVNMYNLEHNNAIADWNMQNAYNSPQQQMARLKAAGLNPNLVYGSGTDAGGASSPVQEKSAESWNPTSPTGAIMGIGNALSDMTDTQMKLAQLDNLKATNAQIIQETALKAAETINTTRTAGRTEIGTESDAFDLALKSDLRSISVESAQTALNKMQADTTFTMDANDRAWLQNKMDMRKGEYSIKEAIVDIANKKLQGPQIQASTANTQQDTKLKYENTTNALAERDKILQSVNNMKTSQYLDQLDAGLKQNGVQPGDAGWYRWLEILMSQFVKGISGKSGTLPLHP